MITLSAMGAPVLVGRDLLGKVAGLVPRGRFFVITDRNVADAGWADRVEAALEGRVLGRRVVPPGDESKTLRELEALIDQMLERHFERDDHVVAVGGGMVGDLAGFAAAIVKRGCGFVQIPTSLLAQADSAVGGKTGINARQGKNLIGAFHHPSLVLADVETLRTLPRAELMAGYAEIVKYGLIGDRDFFGWCERNGRSLLEADEDLRLEAVAAALRAKIAIVARDERDRTGSRALLNFGHSFGHAIEAQAGLRHGEAVAIGMSLAFRLSVELGLCDPFEASRAEAHLAACGLPTRLDQARIPSGASTAMLLARMSHDKKNVGGMMRLVLAHGIGRAFGGYEIPLAQLAEFLERQEAQR